MTYQPWGRLSGPAEDVRELRRPVDLSPDERTVLPFGNGRSYGDVCVNSAGRLLDARPLGRILQFDRESGVIQAEAGALLSDVLDTIVPRGWFLPVTPGTKFVTLGGAIANDVHGKNHHVAGAFGRHVTRFELARSDGSRIVCSRTEHPDLFSATIGGLGLTGVIVWCELRLQQVESRGIAVETTRFGSLDEFFELSAEVDRVHDYTVSWVDCLAGGQKLGRGWLMAGGHTDEDPPARRGRRLNFFVRPPFSLVNAVSLRVFNFLYYHRPVPDRRVVDPALRGPGAVG